MTPSYIQCLEGCDPKNLSAEYAGYEPERYNLRMETKQENH